VRAAGAEEAVQRQHAELDALRSKHVRRRSVRPSVWSMGVRGGMRH
jgi:hypothetical protein